MISLLAKKFIKNREDVTSPAVRQAYGMLCGRSEEHTSELQSQR